jgi:predicted enzyme related to lactoylglutathione lyase
MKTTAIGETTDGGFRELLQRELAKRCAENPQFSLRAFAKALRIDHSTLSQILRGVVNTGSETGIQGGIWPAPPEGHGMVQLFVEVDDVKATAKQTTELGGNVIIQPQVLPDGDEMHHFVGDTSRGRIR